MALPSVAVHKSRGLRCARLAVTAWVGRRVASCRERLFGRRRLSLRKDARVSSAYLEARAIPVARSFKYGPQNGFGQREDGIQKVLLIPGGQTGRSTNRNESGCFCLFLLSRCRTCLQAFNWVVTFKWPPASLGAPDFTSQRHASQVRVC